MPRVPEYGIPRERVNNFPSATFDNELTVERATAPGRRLQEQGRIMGEAAREYQNAELKELDRANKLRVADALNQLKEQEYKLTYDREAGFSNLTGVDALQRPEGVPLADEYAGKFDGEASRLAAGLGNDVQREMFSRYANESRASFYGRATQHEASQFREYAMSVHDATIKNALNDITLNYNRPDIIAAKLQDIDGSVYDAAKMQGKSAAFAEARARELSSNAHLTAVKAALDANDPQFADDYLKRFSKTMEADDLLSARGLVTKKLNAKLALSVADKVGQKIAEDLAPSATTRAFNILLKAESGGRQLDSNGQPVTSKAGAIGIAQVMPATAPEAAKLAGLEWDEQKYRTDAEYNKALGKAYFEKQLKDNGGSLAKAYAAYNAGPGALAEAQKKAEADGTPAAWITYLPSETQDYVTKNMAAFEKGGGAGAKPSLADVHRMVREEVGSDDPERLSLAIDEATSRYELMQKMIKQKEEEATTTAFTALVQNGGKYTDLAPEIVAAIPADKVPSVMEFASKIAKGVEPDTDWSLYYQLRTDPELLAGVNLMGVRDKLGGSEFKELTRLQQSAKQDPDGLGVLTTKDTLNQYLREAGIATSPKAGTDDAAKLGRIWRAFDSRIRERQSTLGRKLNPDEVNKEAARLMTSVEVDDWFTNSTVPAAALGEGERDKVVVPAAEKAKIVEALKRRGKPPTEAAVRQVYLNLLTGSL